MKKQPSDRKTIARRRIRGLIIFLIVVLFAVLLYDVYLLIKGWIN